MTSTLALAAVQENTRENYKSMVEDSFANFLLNASMEDLMLMEALISKHDLLCQESKERTDLFLTAIRAVLQENQTQ